MTYTDNPELVTSVLTIELERQREIAKHALKYIQSIDEELEPLQEQRAGAELSYESALALIAGLEKVLDKQPEPEAPVEEDPYDVAFGTTTATEAPKDQTFDHRAPMFINTTTPKGFPEDV